LFKLSLLRRSGSNGPLEQHQAHQNNAYGQEHGYAYHRPQKRSVPRLDDHLSLTRHGVALSAPNISSKNDGHNSYQNRKGNNYLYRHFNDLQASSQRLFAFMSFSALQLANHDSKS